MQNGEWLDELVEEVTREVNTVAKFKRHKERKDFLGRIKYMIKEAVVKNTKPKDLINTRDSSTIITKPKSVDSKSQGFAVMTEGKSMEGDELKGVGPS